MSGYLFDQKTAIENLRKFFSEEKPRLNSFGRMVNQTFEAYTFASTIKWYEKNGWLVHIKNPKIRGRQTFRLKFSTRGAPEKYSYAQCEKGEKRCQIRHQLRLATKTHKSKNNYPANICSDVAIIDDMDLSNLLSDESVPNNRVISFGEVKHMSAFAELIAGFIGVVHELQPKRLRKIRINTWKAGDHIAPYLNVSGYLQRTAKGLDETIKQRKYDIDIYFYENKLI